MVKLIIIIFTNVFCFTPVSFGANVLVVFVHPFQSHNILGQSLSRGLAKAGYNVTMIGAFEHQEVHDNLTNIALNGIEEALKESARKNNIYSEFDFEGDLLKQGYFYHKSGEMILNFTLSHQAVKDLLSSKIILDVIVLEQFACDGLKYLASYFKAPLVMLTDTGSNKWLNALVGNPAPPSFVPNLFTTFSNDMNFLERFQNFLFEVYMTITWDYFSLAPLSEIIRKQFPGGPDFYQSLYNISIVLVNGHESYVEPVPKVPNMINIGGFHVNPSTKGLPVILNELINNAKHGVIYFSMGSILKPSSIPNQILKIILETLDSRKERVIFSWGSEDFKIARHYPNIKFFKWLPQQDILAHPNVKIFITHGGILSITESISHGVPMLVLPLFADQHTNAARIVKWRIGRRISLSKINKESFQEALEDVLIKSLEYKTNAQYRSKLFHDRPVKPMDLAIYWIDYVIRHNGAPHLRVAGLDLKWYQYIMLDVVAALSLFLVLLVYLLRKIIVIIIYRKNIKIKQA